MPTLDDFRSTETGALLEALYPGVTAALASENPVPLYDVTISGAATDHVVGLHTSVAGWATHPARPTLLECAVQGSYDAYASDMLDGGAITLQQSGSAATLSNVLNANSTQTNVAAQDAVSASMAFQTALGGDKRGIVNEITAGNVVGLNCMIASHSDSSSFVRTVAALLVAAYAQTDKMKVATQLFARSVGFVGRTDAPVLVVWQTGGATAAAANSISAVRGVQYLWLRLSDGFNNQYCAFQTKFYPIWYQQLVTQYPLPADGNSWSYQWQTNDQTQTYFVIGIPIGIAQLGSTSDVLVNLTTPSNQWAWAVDSSRGIISVPNATRGAPNPANSTHPLFYPGQAIYECVETEPTLDALGLGESHPASPVPVLWAGTPATAFLCVPLLGIPGQYEFAHRGSLSELTEVVYSDDDQHQVVVYELVLTANRSCYGIPYAWYNDYISSGFGLKTPLAPASVTAALSASSSLQNCTVTGVFYPPGFTYPNNIVELTTIYQDYADARRQACQPNDFYDQKFDSKRTWAAVRTAVNQAQPLRDVYGIRYGSATVGTWDGVAVSSGAYSSAKLDATTVVSGTTTTYTLVYTAGSAPPVDVTDVAAIATAIVGGCAVTAAGQAGIDAVFGAGSFQTAVDTASASAITSAGVGGLRGTGQNPYDLAWESLSLSGYVLYDEMLTAEKYNGVVMSVASYASFGRPLMQALQQFNYPALSKQIKVSLPKPGGAITTS